MTGGGGTTRFKYVLNMRIRIYVSISELACRPIKLGVSFLLRCSHSFGSSVICGNHFSKRTCLSSGSIAPIIRNASRYVRVSYCRLWPSYHMSQSLTVYVIIFCTCPSGCTYAHSTFESILLPSLCYTK